MTVRYESVISRDISRAQFGRKAELPHDNGGNGRHEREDSGISPVTRSA